MFNVVKEKERCDTLLGPFSLLENLQLTPSCLSPKIPFGIQYLTSHTRKTELRILPEV